MVELWRHVFDNELKVNSEEHPVLLTEAPMNPDDCRKTMCVKFFEELKVPEYYVMTQAVLALYSSGRTTGLVADAGDGVLHTVVVFDGYCIKHAVKRLNLAGRDLTQFMRTLLLEIGLNLESSSGVEIARDIKEKTCYVAIDY